MDNSIVTYFFIAVFSQLLIAVYIAKNDAPKKSGEKYIWLYFLILASILLLKLVFLFFDKSVLSQSYSPSLSLALPPLLYMYVKSTLENKPISKREQLLHLIPTIIISAAFIFVGFRIAFQIYSTGLHIYKKIYDVFFFAANLSYLPYIIYLLTKTKEPKENSPKWLQLPLILMTLSSISLLLKKTLHIPYGLEAFFLLSLFGIFFFVLQYLRLKFIKGAIPEHNTLSKPETPKYEKSALKSEQAQEIYASLEKYMNTGKPYLNAELSLADVSKQLNIPKHYITEVLNVHFKKNFFLFVNEYRVKEALEKMEEDPSEKIFIIADLAGFKSKTTFIKYFKEVVGVSPSDYKKEKAAS